MFRRVRSHALNFSMENKGDTLFAAGLVAIIALSLGLTIYMTFFNTPGSRGTTDDAHFKCLRCEEETVMTNKQLGELVNQDEDDFDMGVDVIDCPKCGTKRAAGRMEKCPECEKYFLSKSMEMIIRKGPSAIGMMDPDYRPKCPHCGADIWEARKKKAANR